MNKLIAIVMMVFAVIMVGCHSKTKYEDDVRQFSSLSLEFMTTSAHQLANIYDDAEYKAQQAVMDSINGKIAPLYDSLLKNKEDNGEYFNLVKEMRRAEVDMMAALEMMKMNDDTGDLTTRNKCMDDYSEAQSRFIKAMEELSLILPHGDGEK